MTTHAKDRLDELIQAQKHSRNVNIDIEENGEIPSQFKDVYEKVFEIRNLTGNIKENTKKTRELIQVNILPKKSIHDQIEARYKDTCNISFKITNELKALDVKSSKKEDNSDKSVLARVKRIQYASLRQDFQNALFESNDLLENYRDQKRNYIKRQAALVNSSLNDEELESLLDNADVSQLFTDNILLETRIAKDELCLIEERHAELLNIESMLVEVNEQFKKVAILVEQQKENINRIEFHAGDAINYVDLGLIDIQKAERHKRKSKKIFVYICIAVVIILIIILLLI